MAIVAIPGPGPLMPSIPSFTFGNDSTMLNRTAATIDATGEKYAMVGRHWNKDRATKSIRKVGILFGSVVKAGGSALTLSLQDVSLTLGPPLTPDETQDQAVAIANASATFASNTFHLTGNLSADRSTAFGALLAVVIEFDGGGRLSSDSVGFSTWSRSGVSHETLQLGGSLKTASWGVVNQFPIVLFEYDDGTFGTLAGCWPCSTVNVIGIDSSTTPDEVGIEFQVPTPMSVDGGWGALWVTAAVTFDVVLYDGTSPMSGGTVSIDPQAIRVAGVYQMCGFTFDNAIDLQANHTYRVVFKPTTAAAQLNIPYFDVGASGHMQALPMGEAFTYTGRTDGGSFSPTTTRRVFMGLRQSGYEAGGGGGGAPIISTHATPIIRGA